MCSPVSRTIPSGVCTNSCLGTGANLARKTPWQRDLAASRYVFTIGYVARMLDEDENRIAEIAMDMEPEDGCHAVVDINDESTLAFTTRGIESLKELLEDLTET